MNLSLSTLLCVTIALSIDAGFIPDFDGINININGQPQSQIHTEISPLMSVFKSEFHTYKLKFNKIYQSVDEENTRFSNFISSFMKIESHNELMRKGQKQYKMAINHFSDWV